MRRVRMEKEIEEAIEEEERLLAEAIAEEKRVWEEKKQALAMEERAMAVGICCRKPTAQQQRWFKEFKEEVRVEAQKALDSSIGWERKGMEVKIGNMECVFYPLNQKILNEVIRCFPVSKWCRGGRF